VAVSVNVVSKVLDGSVWAVRVEFGDGTYRVFRVRDDADLDAQILAGEAVKARVVTLGAREVVAPATPTPKVPTQDDIDREAFVVLVRDIRSKRAEVDAGVGKTTQADVDAAVASMKDAYKDEYAPLLVGVF